MYKDIFLSFDASGERSMLFYWIGFLFFWYVISPFSDILFLLKGIQQWTSACAWEYETMHNVKREI